MFRRRLILLSVIAFLTTSAITLADSPLIEIDDAIVATNYHLALELIDEELDASPDDVSLLLRRARVQDYVGDYDAALITLEELRETYPHDVDYAFARAQVLARQGRDREALDDLREAVMLAPHYEEVWRLRFTLLQRQDDESTHLERDSLMREAADRFPQASWWRTTEDDPVARWTVLVGAGHDSLSDSLPSWNQQFIEVSRDQGRWGRYRVSVARDERFDNSDLSVQFGSDLSFASDWSAGLNVTFASDPNFQPALSYGAFVGRSLPNGWVVNLKYRRREYETAIVGSAIGTAEKYLGDYRFAYALDISHLHGATDSTNHTLTVNWYYNERASIGVTVNTGDEAKAIGIGRVLQSDVRGASVSGRHQFTDRLGLHWWLGLHDQGNFYRRQYLGMAVSIRL